MCVLGFVIMEMECKRTIYAIKEHRNLTKSPMTACSVTRGVTVHNHDVRYIPRF